MGADQGDTGPSGPPSAKPLPERGPPIDAPRQAEPRRSRPPHGPTPGQARRRRLTAVLIGFALLAGAAFLLFAGGEQKEPATPVPAEVAKAVKGLSLAEKVDAVLAVGFTGTKAPEAAPTQGGVVIEPGNWPGAAAGRSLLSAIHASGKAQGRMPPLVIGLQEGGQYRAYPDLPPPARELDIGFQRDPAIAESSSEQAASALKKAGFDLNLGLVADVATLDSPISDRAYGDEAAVVSAMTKAAVQGCAAAELLCAVSHFPGQGAASADTGDGPATVGLDANTLKQRDLEPFRAAFAAKVPAVVLSHAFYAAYDAVTPGSLTAPIVTGLLREEMHFKGAAITDDLSAGAIRGGGGGGDASVQALGAGADLLLVSDPADAEAARAALLEAVHKGQISSSRLDEAAGRVLALKRSAGLDISM